MKVRGLRWWILGLIMLVSIINYLDRGTLAYMWVANTKRIYTPEQVQWLADEGKYIVATGNTDADGIPEGIFEADADKVTLLPDGNYRIERIEGIATDLGIVDPTEPDFESHQKELYFLINIIFMIAYGLSQLFSGKLYDKIGVRRGFAFSAILWGISDALTSLVGGLKSLMGFRFGLGLGEAGPWPGTTKTAAEWFPSRERPLAQGMFNASTSVGGMLAPLVIAAIFLAFGWRMTFVIVGSLGMLWVIPWLVVNKATPKNHSWITPKEQKYILDGQSAQTEQPKGKSWGKLLSERKNYALIVGRFFIDPVWWIFITSIPLYLRDVFSMDIKQVAYFAWVPYVGAAVGSFLGGWFSGYLQRRGKTVNFSRKFSIIVGSSVALCGVVLSAAPQIVFGSATPTALFAVVMIAIILGGYQFQQASTMTLASDMQQGRSVGSLAGLGGAAAVLGTILAMLFVPMLTAGGNWTPFFVMGGLLFPLSIFAIFTLSGNLDKVKK